MDPTLIPDPRDGRPRTTWDRDWEATTGLRVPQDQRAVPRLGKLALVTRKSLYDDDRALCGRPLKFGLETASAIKDAYWSGRKNQRELAEEHGTTILTIGRMVRGGTYWYA